MATQEYIPAQPDGPEKINFEEHLRVPLAIAAAGIRKVRSFLLLNIINTLWIGYFYKAHTEASLLWMAPVFFVLILIIVHQWFLYFALRNVLQLPAKMQTFGPDTWTRTDHYFQQNGAAFSGMQGGTTQLSDTMKVFRSFDDSRAMTKEVQEMMSAIVRAILLGNPLFLGLSLGISSLMLLAGFILLVFHIS